MPDQRLSQIRQKASTGEPVSRDDALFLFDRDTDLEKLRIIADTIRESLHGDRVYYNVNAHLNPTNICKLRCPLCAFSCDADDERAYLLGDDEITGHVKRAMRQNAKEIHIVGGIHPDKPYSWYRDILERIHETYPQLQLKAWTAIEIAHFARITGQDEEAILLDLMRVGLSGLPGGGAEIFSRNVREKIAPEKGPVDIWLRVHKTAHRLGLATNATMLFGHIESTQDRVDHLLKLRELQQHSLKQKYSAAFEAFVPLVFHPRGTQFPDVIPANRDDILRTIAVSRIVLNNIPHIKAYWVSLGLDVAKEALHFGANDFDGTIQQEKVHHAAGAGVPVGLSVEELENHIIQAGRTPIERDSHYKIMSARQE